MSAELLAKLRNSIEEDEGLVGKTKNKKKSLNVTIAENILIAANRGQVELGDEEKFLVERKVKKNKRKVPTHTLNVKHATEGYSLVSQIRDEKPRDLKKRNIKYMKYTEQRKLDDNKVRTMLNHHARSLTKKHMVRTERQKLDCLREPKPVDKRKAAKKSVFTDKDFRNIMKNPRKVVQADDGTFI